MALALGVHVGQQNMTMAEMRALWVKLDKAKVDWISAWDHFYEAPPAGGSIDHFEAMTTLGALAADTSHARLGCLVFYVGYRNPARLQLPWTTSPEADLNWALAPVGMSRKQQPTATTSPVSAFALICWMRQLL